MSVDLQFNRTLNSRTVSKKEIMFDQLGGLLCAPFLSNLILVVGTGRSGTSVLLQALGQHPYILDMPGEAPYLTTIGGSAYLFEEHRDRQYYVESLKVPKTYFYGALRRLAFEVSGGPHFAFKLMVKGLMGRGRSPLGRRAWCAKTFPGAESTIGLLALYPTLRIVYIVRNGCDVVHSMTKFKGFSDEDFRSHCLRWAEGVEKYRYLTSLPQALIVTHEALLNDPETLFARIFPFLGLPHDRGPAEFARSTVVHPLDEPTRRGVDPRSALNSRRPPYEDWTVQQKAIFTELCGYGMRELGYEIPF